MIANEKEYKVTLKRITEFNETLQQLQEGYLLDPNPILKAQIAAVNGRLQDLTTEAADYKLGRGKTKLEAAEEALRNLRINVYTPGMFTDEWVRDHNDVIDLALSILKEEE